MRYSSEAKQAFLTSIMEIADSGTGNAYLTITAGSEFFSEFVLATFQLNKPCGTVSVTNPHQLTFDIANNESIIVANGLATRWRLHKSDGTTVALGDVTELGGNGSIRFSSTDWEADGVAKATLDFAAIAADSSTV